MTREEAIEKLNNAKGCPLLYDSHIEAINMSISALENIGHLTDRPCSVCEFRKENGCCKWDCVFD